MSLPAVRLKALRIRYYPPSLQLSIEANGILTDKEVIGNQMD
jgi:hypothetical protein